MPTPAGSGVDALRLPAVGIVIIAVVVKERAHHPEPVVVVMVKVVMGKALPVEFASSATASQRARSAPRPFHHGIRYMVRHTARFMYGHQSTMARPSQGQSVTQAQVT
jgi:hypothetical protein